jgi:Flp pilus assembly protein TadD
MRVSEQFEFAVMNGTEQSWRKGVLLKLHGYARSGRAVALLLCLCQLGMAVYAQTKGPATGNELEQARQLAVAGKLKQAEGLLQTVIEQNPASADAHFLLGYVYFRDDEPRKSLAAFTAGARTRRPGVNSLRVVASDYVLLKDFTDASKWFGVVAKEEPSNSDNWYLLGRSQYNENRFQDAVNSFQRVLALRPRDVTAENNLGLAWQGMNEMAKAKQAFQTAIAWQGTHPANAQPFLNMGIVLVDGGHPGQAEQYLKSAVSLAPENPKIREQLGRAYQQQKKYAQAQAQLEAAVKLAPRAAGLHFELGQIYYRRGLRSEAQQQFKICQQLNGSHSSISTPNPYSPR